MDENESKQKRSWAEENGATIFGVGTFVLLGLVGLMMRSCG